MDIQNNSLNLETSETNLKAGLNQVFHWQKKITFIACNLYVTYLVTMRF